MSVRSFLIASSVFVLAACGGGGGGGGGSTSSGGGTGGGATVDTTRPTLSFASSDITVVSGQTQTNALSASDNVAITSGPVVTCTNNGSFASNVFTAPSVTSTTQIVCEATASDAAGNSGSALFTATVTPAATPVTASMSGSATKGLILGGVVTVVDPRMPDTILATGTTSSTDGVFQLPVNYAQEDNIDLFLVTVTGGPGAQMICDAPAGCGAAGFGQAFNIDDTFSLSGIVNAPREDADVTANLSVMTDLAASLTGTDVTQTSLRDARETVLRVFGFDAGASPAPIDLTVASPGGTPADARLSLISGGLLQSALQVDPNVGVGYANFRTVFAANDGDILALEAVNDTAVISLQEIYQNAQALKAVMTASSDDAIAAADALSAQAGAIAADAVPDTLTSGGSLIVRDTVAPVLAFNATDISANSAQSVTVVAQITDDDPAAALSAADCTGGAYDIATQQYTAPAGLTEAASYSCTVTVADSAGNTGEAGFNIAVAVAPDTTGPVLSFSPATLSLVGGSSAASVLSASDDVAIAGDVVVTCDIGSFADDSYSAPAVTANTPATCTATAADTSGNISAATLNIAITTEADLTPPSVSFTPTSLSVESGRSASASLSATDNVGLSGPLQVSCTNGGSFTRGTFTAPFVLQDTTSVCTATATDFAGNTNTSVLTVQVAPADIEAPNVSFSTNAVTVGSGQTAAVTVTATDNVGLQGDVSVTCDEGGTVAGGVFTAPVVTAPVTTICTAVATDTSGNVATDVLTAQITFVADNEDPIITFNFTGNLSVASVGSAPFDFTVTDNVGVASQSVTCDRPDLTYANGVISAAFTATAYSERCTVRAADAAGNTALRAIFVDVSASPDEPPQITFSPASMELGPSRSGFTQLSAIDRHGSVAAGPDVTCTGGVTFADGIVTAPDTQSDINAVCTATATDDAGLTATVDLPVSVIAAAGDPVISGTITFDTYGIDPGTGGIDNTQRITRPGKGLTVEILDAADAVVATAQTDASGHYAASLPADEAVKVRVAAQIEQAGHPDKPAFVEERFSAVPVKSRITDVGFINGLITTQDVHFEVNAANRDFNPALNIIDVIWEGQQKFKAVDSAIVFPKLTAKLSESGSEITERYGIQPTNENSHYTSRLVNGEQRRTMHIAWGGRIIDNTDYWDRHVIAHQFAHYIEDSFGRYDSPGQYVGGEQTDIADPFDLRIAFSDGFANAVAGMILDDPIYRDTFVKTEAERRFYVANTYDLETGDTGTSGWFNVRSVQNIIWDLYDDANEQYPNAGFLSDSRSVGLAGIFNALRHPLHKDTPYLTSIFSYRAAMDAVLGETETAIYVRERVYGSGGDARSATTDGGDAANLPIYTPRINGPMSVCSVLMQPEYSDYNLGITKFISFTVTSDKSVTFDAISSQEFGASEPEMILYKDGVQIGRTTRNDAFGDLFRESLTAGDYVLAVFDHDNFLNTAGKGTICIDYTIGGSGDL